MRIIFFGTGAFAMPSLEALLDSTHDVAALVTQPDREKGRGRGLSAPPTKILATHRGLPVLQPARIRAPEAADPLRTLAPDVQVVVAYGQILPGSVIDIPRLGTINVHASLLPRYRGAAPIQWAIINGERETGVTTMRIDEGLDTGPTLLSRSVLIGVEETAPQLEARLARLGAEVLLETLARLEDGSLQPQPQDHSRATLAPILKKSDGLVDWSQPADVIARRVRGLNPWPGTFVTVAGRALKLLRVSVATPGSGAPGAIVAIENDDLIVACGHGSRLRLIELQPESRRGMAPVAFARGARLSVGDRLR